MHRARKFSHVFGQTSENNSKTILPSAFPFISMSIKHRGLYPPDAAIPGMWFVCLLQPVSEQIDNPSLTFTVRQELMTA